MADRTVLLPLSDLEWIRNLGGRLRLPARDRSFAARNGFRDPTYRVTRTELERIKRIIREHSLPCEILRTSYGTELAVYVEEHGGKRDIMRLTHHHIPSHAYDPRHRRSIAIRTFTTFVEELRQHQALEHSTQN